MNKRSIVIIIATLILGFILGMLTSAQIRYHKLKPVRVFFSEDRFREMIYTIVSPDDVQKEKLEVVIRKYAKRNRDIQINFRKELEDFMSDLWKEMSPLLTDEQKEKLEEMERKRLDFTRQGRGRSSGDSLNRDDDFKHRMRSPGDSIRMRFQGDSFKTRYPADSLR